MAENPTTGGSSMSGGRGSHSGFAATPIPLDGPPTIINPERRPGGGSSDSHHGAGSAIWSRLFPAATAPGERFESPSGCRLGHFRIENPIGSGGMGAVFRAVDERLDRVVALKVLSPTLARDPASVNRFVNEARAAARLDHDNIARVYYVGNDQGLHFIAHEFITGRNIRDMIHTLGPLEPRDAINYTLQIATALRHASTAGVVHRDIKPSNIIIDPRGRAKLVDLGLAKKTATESMGDLTVAGTTLGTFDYISPEQAKDPRSVDVRSDIYSLGCTFYHMLTGEPPYPEGTVLQKLLDHQAREVPDPAIKNPRVSPQLSAAVRKMMAPEPRDRFATADDLMIELLPIAAELGLRAVNPEGLVWTSQQPRGRSFLEQNMVWIGTVAALLVFAFLIDGFSQQARKIARQDEGTKQQVAKNDSGSFDGQQPLKTDPGRTVSSPSSSDPSSFTEHPQTVAKTQLNPQNPTKEQNGGDPTFTRPIEPNEVFGAPTSPVNPDRLTPGKQEERTAAATSRPNVPPISDPTPRDIPPEISVTEAGVPQSYPTIAAAIAAAKDGSTVELKFNGPRSVAEKPFRVSGKRVIVRGAKGYRPIVSIAGQVIPTIGVESRMITLNNGGLEFVDLDIQATVPESSGSDGWAMFALRGADRLRLRGVGMTVINPANRQADVVDVSTGREQMNMADMTGGGLPKEFEVEIDQSFIRGGCGLFNLRTGEAGRLEVKQTAVALEGAFLTTAGAESSAGEGRRIALRLEHVTSFLGKGFVLMDAGESDRRLTPLDITARNNIFATNSGVAMFVLNGRTLDDDLRRLVRWEGARNFFDNFAAFWTSSTTLPDSPQASLQFGDWKRMLGDSDANNDGIAWNETWRLKPFAQITKKELELSKLNQAISAATDGKDPGVDLAVLRPLSEPDRGE